ncbi:MAG: hypothetical protein A3A33_03900 [Candidatus Yanofskybacteria bacterium RIFCSPLOWO2_01_FULL_49_25]|uniref:Nudix hydrolase domain-containing protein n=1 Tax=Candidatus Yanofskybacteria bacterium RIFCSPLOWO2_01_FULL_49_25 TaxID=1802701 RepID=A0A1F8GRK4_9BACT|nr:MAG: hypothetical protein A3A33_03900 [Candidatus Yanofskybacteria bacterium RIFCSPLOWO2_01_FULL_49_25]
MKTVEYVDVCDREGNTLGSSKPKREVHEQGIWHRVSHIWIVNSKGELLLQLRSLKMTVFPGRWDISAAGHVSAGEEYIAAAVCEVKEELGLDILEKDLHKLGIVRQEIPKDNYIIRDVPMVYIVHMDHERDMSFIDGEVTESKWIPYQELRAIIGRNDPAYVPHPEGFKLLFNYLDDYYAKTSHRDA